MQIRKSFVVLCIIGIWSTASAQSTGHIGHSGESGALSCVKAKITHYHPEHLATAPSGAEISFIVSGSNGPGHIHVTVRDEPLELSLDDKEAFYVVKTHLPAKYKNEAVRVNIKVDAKYSRCDAEGGLLLKVSE